MSIKTESANSTLFYGYAEDFSKICPRMQFVGNQHIAYEDRFKSYPQSYLRKKVDFAKSVVYMCYCVLSFISFACFVCGVMSKSAETVSISFLNDRHLYTKCLSIKL